MNNNLFSKSKIYTLSAVLIGYALLEQDWSANKQNAIANWFILIGQILETNSGFSFLQNNNGIQNNKTHSTNDDLENIKEVLNIMQNKINEINKNR